MKFGFVLFFMSVFSYAQSDPRSKVIVNSVDQETQIEGLDQQHFKVVNGLAPQKSYNRTPTPAELDSYFKEADLLSEVSGLDQLDKDFLYRKAKSYKIERLVKTYPQINENKLKKFKELVQK